MRIYSDSFFKMGNSHDICQDYAMDYQDDKRSVAVLGDGCSSNPNSDFGSKLLVANTLDMLKNDSFNPNDIIYRSKYLISSLGLHQSNLNSTLLSVSLSDREDFKVRVFGDGVIVARDKFSQDLHVINIEYPSGAPFYLQYLLSKEDIATWESKYSSKVIVTKSFIENTENGSIKEYSKEELAYLNNYLYETTFDLKRYDLVAVLSDGVHSFRELERSIVPYGHDKYRDVPYLQIIKELFEFKLLNGVFVKRRCKKFFKDKYNLTHYDDFSIAAISHFE